MINDNAYELDLPDTYLGSHSFNINDLTPFFASLPNSWTNSLSTEEHDETQGERTPTHDENQAQTMTLTPIPQTITRSRAQNMGVEHQLVSLFVISIE